MLRRTDTGAAIDTDYARWALRERPFHHSSYAQANRRALAIKEARNASKPDAWRGADWEGLVQLSFMDIVDRPTERAAFARLYRVTQRRHRVHAVAVQVWRQRKRGAWESLRDLHARLGLTLEWFNGEAVLLDKDEAA